MRWLLIGYRLFHHPMLYKHIHKIHHEWTAPIGVVSIYAHPLEHLVSNLLPLIIGPIVVKAHLSLTWFWYCLAILNTVNAHSGYHMPFMLSSEGHNFHHLKYASYVTMEARCASHMYCTHNRFTNNFGVLGILDWLHGTDKAFRKTAAYKRHRIVLSLTPSNQMYTDYEESLKEKDT